MVINLQILMHLFFAKLAICVVGSDPIERMQTSGVLASDSDQVASKSRICISPYSGPSDSKQSKCKFSTTTKYVLALAIYE